jgi:homogentisate 1,2-dioxygenase
MISWIKGRTARQAHVGLPEGTVEEEHGRDGFYGAASQLYRLHAPTGWTRIEGPLRPRALDGNAAVSPHENGRKYVPLLRNADVVIGLLRRTTSPGFFSRNADGDELHFVHRGHGTYETDYGTFGFRRGDYVLLPRGTTWRQVVSEPTMTLVIEAREGQFRFPDRGPLGRNAVLDPSLWTPPEPEARDEQGEFEVVIQREDRLTSLFYPFHPLDVVGWRGDLAPLRCNVDEIRPVAAERYHLPPSAHSTLVCSNAVVCTFAPRPVESDPEALRLPFFHRNTDYDEVIFYHEGDFFSRTGIGPGWFTWHPAGIHHGPQPGAVERDARLGPGHRRHEELAVMIDTRFPLAPTGDAERAEWPEYHRSWQR